MLKRSELLLAVFLCLFVLADAFAQNGYALVKAKVRPEDPDQKQIEILFGDNVPPDTNIADTNKWLVQVVNLAAGAPQGLRVVDVLAARPMTTGGGAVLTVGERLDANTQKILVIYQDENFPNVTVGAPEKVGASRIFSAAKGKDDADIYFSGTAAGARGSKPLYTFESKVGYLQRFSFGSLGGRATADAAKESNIDPDSIKATGTYEKVILLGTLKSIILESDFLGAEFDKDNRTRNLSTGLDAKFIIPPARLGEKTYAAIQFLAGFEGGHNYRHKLNPEGLGNYWRWKLGANAYFLMLNPPGLNRIDFNTDYKVRLLNSFEPFSEKINDEDVVSLRKKPRHYVASDLDFMFSDSFGVSLKYRYGSLPPAFKFIDHSVSLGLTFKLKQVNR